MNFLRKIFNFYYYGFKSMTVGKTLWIIIFIKLFIMFAILKVFFFPNFLNSKTTSYEEKIDYVLQELTDKTKNKQ